MTDKTIIASFAANEILRINERLKNMIESKEPPPEEFRKSVIEDIENTLSRLERALSQINTDELDDDKEDTKQ